MFARSVCLLAVSVGALTVGTSAQTPDIDMLLARVAERIELYYKRAQNVICTEKVLAQPISRNMSQEGFGRSLEYELRVESVASGEDGISKEPQVVRELRKVNGRTPRDKDKPGCFDPNPLTPEPLAFLLPANREGYTFTSAGYGKGKDASALLIDFVRIDTSKPEFIEDEMGRPECFQLSLPMKVKGRVWISASTYEVLRVEEHLAALAEFRVPFDKQRKHNLPDSLVIDRYDLATRYKLVSFTDPEETLLLPESIDLVTVIRGAQSHRKRQSFSNYRRFVTEGRIVK